MFDQARSHAPEAPGVVLRGFADRKATALQHSRRGRIADYLAMIESIGRDHRRARVKLGSISTNGLPTRPLSRSPSASLIMSREYRRVMSRSSGNFPVK